MSETRTSTGRPALACDGRNHADGDHECARRFWSPSRADPATTGDLRLRALHRGWWWGARDGKVIDLCPYHAPSGRTPSARNVRGGLLDGMPLGSSATVKPNDTGGLDVFVIRTYPSDDPPEGG